MLLTTISNETVQVEPRDIAFLTSHNIVGVKRLTGPNDLFQLTDDSAQAVRDIIEPRLALPAPTKPWLRTEGDLFDLAAAFSRRQVFDFRVPGTTASHKVECVVMEPSDLAAFAAALGVPTTMETPPAPIAPERPHTRMTDRLARPAMQRLVFESEFPRDDKLDALVDEYYHRTEAYDRSVRTGPIGPDGAIPATHTERAQIAANALNVRRELIERAVQLGHTGQDFLVAMRRYDHRRLPSEWSRPIPDGAPLQERMPTKIDGARHRLMVAAIEVIAYQGVKAAGMWPVPGTDPVRHVAIGTAAELQQLVPGAGEKEGAPA
jgi:hypothetical protein